MKRHRDQVALIKERDGTWAVQIKSHDGKTHYARPGNGAQKVVYSRPQNVSWKLRNDIIPKLIDECKLKMMKGE